MTTDWGGYRSILDEAKTLEATDKLRPIVDCPKCGDILMVNSAGVRSCPMGHFRTDAQTYGALDNIGS